MLKLLVNGYKFVNISPRIIVSYNGDGFSFSNQEVCKKEMIEFFKNSYRDITSLTQEQIQELAICHRLDKDTLSKLKNFYREKNPLLFEKSKDILKYRLLYSYNLFNLIPIVTNYVKGVSGNFKIQARIFNFIPILGEYFETRCQESNSTITYKIKLFDIIPIIFSKSVSIVDYNSNISPNYKEVKLFNKIILYTTKESYTYKENELIFAKEIKLFNLFLFKKTKMVCLYKTNKCKTFIYYP